MCKIVPVSFGPLIRFSGKSNATAKQKKNTVFIKLSKSLNGYTPYELFLGRQVSGSLFGALLPTNFSVLKDLPDPELYKAQLTDLANTLQELTEIVAPIKRRLRESHRIHANKRSHTLHDFQIRGYCGFRKYFLGFFSLKK